MIQFKSKIDHISCTKKGTMDEAHRMCISNILQKCSEQNAMKPANIRDKLRDKGMRTVVIKDCNKAWAYNSGIEKMKWGEWKSTKYGIYVILMIQYRPKDKNEIECVKTGTMSDGDRNMVTNALKYCTNQDTMDTNSIRDRLSHLGMKSMVINDGNTWSYSGGLVKLTWAQWKSSRYGLFDVIKIHYNVIECIEEANMNNTDKNSVLDALQYCLANKQLKPDDVSKRLQDQGINNIVMQDCNDFSQRGALNQMMWSKWKLSEFGFYTIMIMKEEK